MPNYLEPYKPPVIIEGYRPTAPKRSIRPAATLRRVLAAHRPPYATSIGLVYGHPVAFPELHNRELGCIYELRFFDPTIMRNRVIGYLWGVGDRDGLPRQIKSKPLYDRYF